MNALTGLGLLEKSTADQYALTPESAAFLVSGKSSFMGGLIRHTSTQLIPRWLHLNEVVQTGKPSQEVNQEATGSEFFHAFVEDIFPMSYVPAQALATALDVGNAQKPVSVLDLAAGSGVWGIALAQSSPQVRVTAVDWPAVLQVTERVATRFGVADRFQFVAGDLESADFGAGHNIVILGHILHSEGERRSRELLRKVLTSMAPGGTVAIGEFLVDENRATATMGLLFAVNMLVNTDEGDTFSFTEIASWLQETGFESVRTLDAPGPSPLILANKPTP
jgi:ubiquinone/menaquinone biosynthesis C-methylase UbiE